MSLLVTTHSLIDYFFSFFLSSTFFFSLQKTFVPQKQPYGFAPHIQLKKYQLNAVSWMRLIEEDIGIHKKRWNTEEHERRGVRGRERISREVDV